VDKSLFGKKIQSSFHFTKNFYWGKNLFAEIPKKFYWVVNYSSEFSENCYWLVFISKYFFFFIYRKQLKKKNSSKQKDPTINYLSNEKTSRGIQQQGA
jgi:hypothetical protein